MYFDWRLWAMMEGLRLRVAAAVGLGLIAMAVGILRFVCLARVLALTFAGAPLTEPLPPRPRLTAACVLLRAGLEHARSLLAQDTAGRVQAASARARLFDRINSTRPGVVWDGARRRRETLAVDERRRAVADRFRRLSAPAHRSLLCAPLVIFAVLAWWDVPTAAGDAGRGTRHSRLCRC